MSERRDEPLLSLLQFIFEPLCQACVRSDSKDNPDANQQHDGDDNNFFHSLFHLIR